MSLVVEFPCAASSDCRNVVRVSTMNTLVNNPGMVAFYFIFMPFAEFSTLSGGLNIFMFEIGNIAVVDGKDVMAYGPLKN